MSSYMDTFGKRLAAAMADHNVVADVLAKKVGLKSKQAIYNLVKDKANPHRVRASTMDGLCRELRVNEAWLKTGKGPRGASTASVADESDDWPPVMAYKTEASMGDGFTPDDWMETHKLKFRRESLQRKRLNPEYLGVIYGRGDSMLPRIKSGDAIMFDRRKTDPVDGALFVLTHGGDLYAKRLLEIGGRWFMESLNKDDPRFRKPVPMDENAISKIHGRVVWIASWED